MFGGIYFGQAALGGAGQPVSPFLEAVGSASGSSTVTGVSGERQYATGTAAGTSTAGGVSGFRVIRVVGEPARTTIQLLTNGVVAALTTSRCRPTVQQAAGLTEAVPVRVEAVCEVGTVVPVLTTPTCEIAGLQASSRAEAVPVRVAAVCRPNTAVPVLTTSTVKVKPSTPRCSVTWPRGVAWSSAQPDPPPVQRGYVLDEALAWLEANKAPGTPDLHLFYPPTDWDWLYAPVKSRNPGCWAKNMGLTCVPTNSANGVVVSPSLMMTAAHNGQPIGEPVTVVDRNNVMHVRSVVDARYFYHTSAYMDDVAIYLLDSPLPATVEPALLLPANWRQYIASDGLGLPVLSSNQNKEITVLFAFYVDKHINVGGPNEAWVVATAWDPAIYTTWGVPLHPGWYPDYSHQPNPLRSGDSSSPRFLCLPDGQNILVNLTTPPSVSGPPYLDMVFQACADMGTTDRPRWASFANYTPL